jgi:hypothetical protein
MRRKSGASGPTLLVLKKIQSAGNAMRLQFRKRSEGNERFAPCNTYTHNRSSLGATIRAETVIYCDERVISCAGDKLQRDANFWNLQKGFYSWVFLE